MLNAAGYSLLKTAVLVAAVAAIVAPFEQSRAQVGGPRSESYIERLAEREAEFEMVAIPAGEFKRRASEVDPKNPNNSVRHEREYSVRPSPFWIGKHEMAWNVA